MPDATHRPPKYFRASVTTDSDVSVERTGGMYDAGLITRASIVTRGEALGHDLWIDHDMLSDVAGEINSQLVKVRFSHPGLSSDGIGLKLGRLKNARVEGDRVLADVHFQRASHATPDGDLADYVMTLSEETPEDFGISIVFDRDIEKELEHTHDNRPGPAFVSPDELNENNFAHARLSKLVAADFVDSPAANPSGLFHRGQEAARTGEEFLEYVLGLSDAKPRSSALSVDPDRAAIFLARFLERHNLSIQKGQTVSDEQAVEPAKTRDEFNADLKRYTEKFGHQNGSEWLAEGVDWETALERQCDELASQVSTLTEKVNELESVVEAVELGESDAGPGQEFVPEGDINGKPSGFAGKIRLASRNIN